MLGKTHPKMKPHTIPQTISIQTKMACKLGMMITGSNESPSPRKMPQNAPMGFSYFASRDLRCFGSVISQMQAPNELHSICDRVAFV